MSFCSFQWSKALQQVSTLTSLTTCELLWFPLKQSAAAAALGAAAAGRAFLSWKGGSRQVSSNQVAVKSPPSHQRGVQPCAPPQFWKQVLTQEFFPHSWKRNCELSASGHTSSTTDNSSFLSSSPHLFQNCFLTFAAAKDYFNNWDLNHALCAANMITQHLFFSI